ncbi:hypothetical protein [Cytobacillus purgationiresistens]|uniref:Group-specific protein n=1 Tax=Cytobacillus purgationiresistens TaxID=863449 RepID=A0ABU0AQI3_9BACI|nr:hypothetical protein [Cytobacillus purgationiresistens]MDQ0273541.1 hypothetical protein [Cytobacillus purgationiresistens]
MKHYSYEEWQTYVKNELEDEVRETYEDHLYSCDQCLDLYLMAVEEDDLPIIENEPNFTDSVMAQIKSQKEAPVPEARVERRSAFYQKSIFHYGIAAAMTLILMSTGVFQSLTQYAGGVESQGFKEKETSMTEGIVDKTFAWMDSFERNNKEDNKE